MYINYLVDGGEEGYFERYEPLNIGYKDGGTVDENNPLYAVFNKDANGVEHRIHFGRSVLTEPEKELFSDALITALHMGIRLFEVGVIMDIIETYLEKSIRSGIKFRDVIWNELIQIMI